MVCGARVLPTLVSMRLITLFLLLLLLAIQYPLWLGKGGWLRVWDMQKQVTAQNQRNAELKQRNTKLEGEVKDLKEGTGAIEERARYELGMVKDDEGFVQFVAPAPKTSETPLPPPPPAGQQAHH